MGMFCRLNVSLALSQEETGGNVGKLCLGNEIATGLWLKPNQRNSSAIAVQFSGFSRDEIELRKHFPSIPRRRTIGHILSGSPLWNDPRVEEKSCARNR